MMYKQVLGEQEELVSRSNLLGSGDPGQTGVVTLSSDSVNQSWA
jgi:hypothetical protein